MKRNWLYRIGAGLLAGILVFTGVPQIFSRAEEEDFIIAQQIEEERDTSDTESTGADVYIEGENGADGSEGVKDENGADGSEGIKDENGADGSEGIKDENGTDGSEGIKNENGADGSEGVKDKNGNHDGTVEGDSSAAGNEDADQMVSDDLTDDGDDTLLEDGEDGEIEDELIETIRKPRMKAARASGAVQENAEMSSASSEVGEVFKIDTTDNSLWESTTTGDKKFKLERTTTDTINPIGDNKNTATLTAKIDQEALNRTLTSGQTAQILTDTAKFVVTQTQEYVIPGTPSITNDQLTETFTATSNPSLVVSGNATITAEIEVEITTTTPSETEGNQPVVTRTRKKFTDECTVYITRLKVRQINLPNEILSPNVVRLKAGDPNPATYPVTFVPSDADDVDDYSTDISFANSSDVGHVTAELLKPEGTDGYRLKLTANDVGKATVWILTGTSNVKSQDVSVEVNEYYPVPLSGVSLRQESASGGNWEDISQTFPCVITEGRTETLRLYFLPDNATEREVNVTPSSLLTITQGTETFERISNSNGTADKRYYREYTVRANTITDDSRLGSDDCVEETVTVTPTNATTVGVRDHEYKFKIKVKKDRHNVTNLSAVPETLNIKDLDVTSTENVAENRTSFRVFLEPVNATQKGITLKLTEAPTGGSIRIKESGQADYRTLLYNETLDATAVASGNSAVCTFDVEAIPDQIGDFCLTVSAKDSSYTGTDNVNITVSHHSIEGIALSTANLTLHETPHTGYQTSDLGEIEATIDPTEANNRKIRWEIINNTPATGSAGGNTVACIVKEDDSQSNVYETEADAAMGKTKIKLIGLRQGTCVVTAKSVEDDSVAAQCAVRVTTGPYSANRIVLYGETGEQESQPIGDTIVMRPNKDITLKAKVEPTTAINANITASLDNAVLHIDTPGTAVDGVTSITIHSLGETGESNIRLLAGGRCEKNLCVQVKTPYMEFAQKELHYAPDEVSEEAIRRDLHVNFYPIISPDPESFERVTNYKLTLVAESGALLTPESANWAEELAKPGEKKLRVKYIYTEGSTDFPFEEELPLVISQYPLVDLVQVINPDKVWNVSNGISLSSISLPTKVDITVRDREADSSENNRRMRADVSWDRRNDRYDPNSKEEQNFTLNGMVTLPEGVRNPNGASLAVQVEVNVREAMEGARTVKTPAASVENGATLAAGAEITLTCETEGALIYYTLDGREATRNGRLYTAPIKLTAKTTVLRAMAYKEGWKDSAPMKIVVYLDGAAVGPTDPDDPNDPDVPTPDDVTPDDKEQIDGKTDGLWAVIQGAEDRDGKVAVFAYTGNAYKPVVHVYDGTKLLKEKRDYTVSYKNNKNAGGPGISENYPAVIITGKGNYEGKVEVPFIIKPQSIEDDSVMMDDFMAVTYNKKAQKPSPKLTWNGKKLVNKKDFTFPEESYKMPGVYTVQVTGIGNFTGTRLFTYEIYETGVSAAKFTVSKIPDQKYTGKRITPEITVKYNGVKLFPNANYEIRYENNLNVGTASVLIVGKGGYKGSKRISFKILPIADMKNVAVAMTFSPSNPVYEGKPVKPASYTLVYHAKELKEGEDYTVSYQNNDKAGKATAIFTGKGAYKGSVKKTFRIGAGSILKATVEMDLSYPYQKGGCKPQPKVVVGDRVLEAGTDYTLSYKNNNKIGNTAQVIIKGKGNYTGSMPKFFAITVQDISNLTVLADDKAYSKGKNAYKTKVQVLDVNGKALKAGTDYAKDVIYTYATGEKKDQPVLPSDVLPVGTRIQVEVRVTQPKLYQGKAYGSFRIVQANIKDAKVKVMDQEYTGKKVKPNKSQIISITLKGVPLTENDYEIISYQNNIERGKAKMTIRGIGDYGGTKVVTFKIKKKGILDLKH